MEDLNEFSLKTTTLFVLVPPGMDFDRDLAIAALDVDPSSDMGALMADAAEEQAKESAEDAAVSAIRSLGGGLFGGGDDEEEDEEEEEEEVPEPVQTVLIRQVEEVVEIVSLLLEATLFGPPADYTETPSPFSGSR